jgi:hypothetical protein
MLATYIINGYLIYRTYKGTSISNIFKSFIINYFFLLCSLYLEPRSVIILNNIAIYYKHIYLIKAIYLYKGV